ncbi:MULTISPECIES: hypothetical protein [Auritidibacter]|uniref:Uncharacterized protein n=1 Tax=Auritidibacter ignavus TaxID=678932 RepID=A0AAJ6DBJ5_9MICC|nr:MULTISPECIES: hypothetical protein [Auritidibacter]PXA79515.1 hypothetical protein DCC26_05485 [Auritidibacter sp. NML120779]AXR74452.1 hypothetical protein DCC27_009285 [Auritidibacter sp. NML130574]NIH72714.1 hypothetical protein [Auritidibacter ignavus]PXA80716.1 hypothetical protein DCC25_05755 [Auritidibacter sp. NML120636]RMX23355.1 hypothetical protein DYI20_04540 [Auritidibacter ignavus]
MPTPAHPAESAEVANTALRDLADATMAVRDPDQLYVVISDTLGGVRALDRILRRRAEAHTRHREHAIWGVSRFLDSFLR